MQMKKGKFEMYQHLPFKWNSLLELPGRFSFPDIFYVVSLYPLKMEIMFFTN